jgi:serine/threonine protein kinase
VLLAEPIEELPVRKPSNIKIKVVDFGIFGSNRGGVEEKSNAGSLKFMSPELL